MFRVILLVVSSVLTSEAAHVPKAAATFESQVPDKNLSALQQLNPSSDNSGKIFTETPAVSATDKFKAAEGSANNGGGEFYVGGTGTRQVIQSGGGSRNDTAVNNSAAARPGVNPTGSNTTLKPSLHPPVDNTTIPVIEPMEMKTTNDDILISYPSTFGANVQIALEDPVTNTQVDHFHPLWFLRPVVKKITNAISFLSHPNTALTPAHIFKKIRDRTLQTLRETYKRICGVDMDDDFENKKN